VKKQFFLVLPLVLLLSGCPKGAQSLAVASDTISHAMADAQQGVNIACNASPPQIDGATCSKLAGDFVKIATVGKTLDASIRANQTTTEIVPIVNAFLDAFKQLNDRDLVGISNPNTRLTISTILTGAEGAISVIYAMTGK